MKLNDEPWGKTWDFGINYDEHIARCWVSPIFWWPMFRNIVQKGQKWPTTFTGGSKQCWQQTKGH